MKRMMISVGIFLVFLIFFTSGWAFSQPAFKIPFKFEAEGKAYPSGSYEAVREEDGKITLRRDAGGIEISITIIKQLTQPNPSIETPQLIFDMVANFKPSYTEYVTDYLLAEVWLNEKDGFLVLDSERSEYTKGIKGVTAK